MASESTSEWKYHLYRANDQHNHDYDKGFNLLEKIETREKNADLMGINYISFFLKLQFEKSSLQKIFLALRSGNTQIHV